MLIPATKLIPGASGFAIAVWKHDDGTIRYAVTKGEQPASVWRDVRDGWEPFKLNQGKDCHAAAYMAVRDSDPYDFYHDLRAALNTALKRVTDRRPQLATA